MKYVSSNTTIKNPKATKNIAHLSTMRIIGVKKNFQSSKIKKSTENS